MSDRLDIEAARSRLQQLEAEIGQLRRLLPKQPAPQPSAALHCPHCNATMEPGTAVVRTLWSFLWVGLSYEHLYFRGDSTDQDECLMTSGVTARGYRCPNCHAVLIQTRGG